MNRFYLGVSRTVNSDPYKMHIDFLSCQIQNLLSCEKRLKMSKFRVSISIAILGLIICLTSCASGYEINTTHIPLSIGDSTVDLVLHDTAVPGLTYLNIHDDENTCVRAALNTIKWYGGRVFELKHSGKRNITFKLEGVEYEFDPNRIFSVAGIEASLERFSSVSDEAIVAVEMFADELLQQIKPAELNVFVTLHNNEPSDNYSIERYTANGDYASEALIVSVTNDIDPNDYYFVTDYNLFIQLSQNDQNVVLQDNEQVTDDGSLSVWSAHQQIPYVNIEVQEGHRRVQEGMIQLLHELYFPDSKFIAH